LKSHRIDVVHVPSYRRLLFRSPCPMVATIHDLAPFHVRGKYDLARMFYGRVVARFLARRQDAIIAISRNTACDVARFFGIPATQQNIILNGMDHTRFNPGDAQAARRSVRERWKLDEPFFLFVSRLEHPAKNHVRLIQAFNRFKQSTGSDLVLALGGGDWHGVEFIRAEAARSPFARDIRFLGFVPDDRLPDLYRAAVGMVYPSLFEGFGLPPIEAMACDCPVLSSERGALAEVVADAADIIDPESIESLSAGLNRMANEDLHRDGLRAAGLRNAQRFNWSSNAKAVLAVYTQLFRKA
jgi:glycosyltransferase involved in cell wall biosynthesis